MARKRYIYLLERIRDCHDWPKGCTIWAHHHLAGHPGHAVRR